MERNDRTASAEEPRRWTRRSPRRVGRRGPRTTELTQEGPQALDMQYVRTGYSTYLYQATRDPPPGTRRRLEYCSCRAVSLEPLPPQASEHMRRGERYGYSEDMTSLRHARGRVTRSLFAHSRHPTLASRVPHLEAACKCTPSVDLPRPLVPFPTPDLDPGRLVSCVPARTTGTSSHPLHTPLPLLQLKVDFCREAGNWGKWHTAEVR